MLAIAREELLQGLYECRSTVKIAFRYYALAGVSNVDDDPNTMTMLQFSNFCRGARLIDAKGLGTSDIDRLFLRAIRPQAPESSTAEDLMKALSKSGIAASKEGSRWKGAKLAVNAASLLGKGSNSMTQPQFVGAVLRLASTRYSDQGEVPIGAKLSRLCSEHLREHVFDELRLVSDDFSEKMESPLMAAVLAKHELKLRQSFAAYAEADTTNTAARHSTATMNVFECHQMCEEIGIYDGSFSVRDMLCAFVRVNIDDDLYVQAEADNTSSEIVFDEFEEFVGRLFLAAVWVRTQRQSETASLLDQDGDGDLDDDDIDELFDECDADGSGSISLEELTAALRLRLNEAAATSFAEQLLSIADDDGSGTMSREELREAIHRVTSDSQANRRAAEGSLERAFDSWLAGSFIPKARTRARRTAMGGAGGAEQVD